MIVFVAFQIDRFNLIVDMSSFKFNDLIRSVCFSKYLCFELKVNKYVFAFISVFRICMNKSVNIINERKFM